MYRSVAQVATLFFSLPSARGWLHGIRSNSFSHGYGKIFRSTLAMSSSERTSIETIKVEELWPNLAGKQTCASEHAGKVNGDKRTRRSAASNTVSKEDTTNDGRSSSVSWSIRRSVVEYNDGDTVLQGLCARPEGEDLPERLPGVILAHTAVGPQEGKGEVSANCLVDVILWKLDALALLGYVAFALDMFGAGRALWSRDESLAARRPITEDRSKMQA
ncbi:unnamed protein product [Hapterophycus canaliculatus]